MQKLNTKHYKFIAGIVKGKSATAAAVEAGFSKASAHDQGYRLMKDADIKREIESQLNVAGFNAERILAEMWTLYEASKAAGSYGPARECLLALGRHHGLWQDQRRVQHTHAFESLLDATKELRMKNISPVTPAIPMLSQEDA